MVSGYLTVTKHLTRRHMQCDTHFPRCGEPDESVNHEFSNAHLPYKIGLSLRHHSVQDLFWRKNKMEDPELDRDLYPWIIWYL